MTAIHSGDFHWWPGLITSAINCHIKTIKVTVQGHLNCTPLKQSLMNCPPCKHPPTNALILSKLPLKNNPANHGVTKLEDMHTLQIGDMHTLLSSTCTIQMQKIAKPIKNCSHSEIMATYLKWYKVFTSRGFKPWLHKINNKTSPTLEQVIKSQQTTIQYTPTDMHRENAAKRAIQTRKNHFITGIAGTPDTFTLAANFCCLTNRCNYTLNMLSPNWQNLKLSTFVALWGIHSFNAKSIAPLCTKCYVHIKPHNCKSWGYHTTLACYLGPKLDNYWCYDVLVQETGAVNKSDTITFNQHAISLHPLSNADQILMAKKHVINHA